MTDRAHLERTDDFMWTGPVGSKKLKGPDLVKFRLFWDVFAYKQGPRPSAKAWMNIPDPKDEAFMAHILYAARQTAIERKSLTHTPKMPQGWLNEARWLNYEPQATPEDWQNWSHDDWRHHLGKVTAKFIPGNLRERWMVMDKFPNPSPWVAINPQIPEVIRDEYKSWGWRR